MWRKRIVVWNREIDLVPELITLTLLALVVGILLGHFAWRVDREPIIVDAPAPGSTQAVLVQNPPIKPVEVTVSCEEKSYKVVKGDTLWDISESEYSGRGYLFPLIAEKNGIRNPNMIHPDRVLTIPCTLSDLPQVHKVARTETVTVGREVVHQVTSAPVHKTWQEALREVEESLRKRGVDINLDVKPESTQVPAVDPAYLDTTKTNPAQEEKDPPKPHLEPLKGLPVVPPEPATPATPEGIIYPQPSGQTPSSTSIPPSFPSRRIFPLRR